MCSQAPHWLDRCLVVITADVIFSLWPYSTLIFTSWFYFLHNLSTTGVTRSFLFFFQFRHLNCKTSLKQDTVQMVYEALEGGHAASWHWIKPNKLAKQNKIEIQKSPKCICMYHTKMPDFWTCFCFFLFLICWVLQDDYAKINIIRRTFLNKTKPHCCHKN